MACVPRVEPEAAPLEHSFVIDNGADPAATMSVLWQGPHDVQTRFEHGAMVRATWTPRGPASLRICWAGRRVTATAWGAGAAAALEMAPGLVGALDDAAALTATDPRVAELLRRQPGLRLTRSGSVFDSLVVSIIGQKVVGKDAQRSYRDLVLRFGEPAPGPFRLRLPPPPQKLARLPYWAFHPLGIERRRADTIRAAAAVAPRLEETARLPAEEGRRRLLALPGVGQWTAAETIRLAMGDPDALSVGDYHLAHVVCWALAGEPRGTDERMVELLEPYRGQRARVALLIEHAGPIQRRRAPRMPLRSIAAF
jgi:3-methyladenine DNA glycosylase/8-oxoguanine DNA glycosylase